MARTVSIGRQGFEDIRRSGSFYVDKTGFIRDWWQAEDDVTLVCRPRRFGKTLMLDTVRCFLSLDFAGRGEELFGGLEVWGDPSMRALQGTVPLVHVSFADCKGPTLEDALALMRSELSAAVRTHGYLLSSDAVDPVDRAFLAGVSDDMGAVVAKTCLKRLCHALLAHHGVRPVVLLDEYDTPMQEAWLGGCWDQMTGFVRSLFNATFKTNPSLGRALITGITRVTQESIFSDMNNLKVVTVSSDAYATSFGFTEEEVFAAMDEFGLTGREDVRAWYDGFTFGKATHVYNPWSVTSYLDVREFRAYWANTSGNGLVGSLVREGDSELKSDFETLLSGGSVRKLIDEQVVFQDLDEDDDAVWSLLLASGYVRADDVRIDDGMLDCRFSLTNHEVRLAFDKLVRRWFLRAKRPYGAFVQALLAGDARGMTRFLNDVAVRTFSSFDSGTHPSDSAEPERFWHGFVLGLLVELRDTHRVLSNRESGWGRYDTMVVPHDITHPAIVLEFKVLDAQDGEHTLEDTVAAALAQIADKGYDAELKDRGFDSSRIRHFGVAFEGKRALVG